MLFNTKNLINNYNQTTNNMLKRILSIITVATAVVSVANAQQKSFPKRHYTVEASNFTASPYMTASGDADGQAVYSIRKSWKTPFTQQCVSNDVAPTTPITTKPYYRVRMALPIPSCYTPTEQGEKVGLDRGVFHHLHSAGMDIMPNGDILAIYFSTPVGLAEADTATTFVQARLRYGSDEWDMPELFYRTEGGNDQSALLYTENNTVWFFGGGRDMTDFVPFRICRSEDSGKTWTYIVPKLDKRLELYTAQPISNAFRNNKGELFVAIDGKGAQSFLMRSQDNGVTWHDMGGRTSSRHSSIVPLDDKGTLLAISGKNNSIDGWNPMNISHDWGATWDEGKPSPFPPLGTAQRPCMIRLQSGALVVIGDSYMHKRKIAPPQGWSNGNDCYAAISHDNGKTWKIRSLPLTLPQHHRIDHPSLGYVTLRQAPDGMLHILTTTNYPGLHIEFNEAWIEQGDETPGVVFPGAAPLNDEVLASGHYFNGSRTEYYPNGNKQHEVKYVDGRRCGTETLWREDGSVEWIWQRDLTTNKGTWTQYYPNGKKRVESNWNLRPEPRDLPSVAMNGYVAEGTATHWDQNGKVTATYEFHNGVETGTETGTNGAGIQAEGK